MEDIKYVDLIQIGPVVIEIWEAEMVSYVAVPVNNTCPVVIEIQGIENSKFVVPVNKILTYMPHSFLGYWHMTMCLDAHIKCKIKKTTYLTYNIYIITLSLWMYTACSYIFDSFVGYW